MGGMSTPMQSTGGHSSAGSHTEKGKSNIHQSSIFFSYYGYQLSFDLLW